MSIPQCNLCHHESLLYGSESASLKRNKFVEDSAIQGGAGSACLEALSAHKIQIPTLQIGLPDEYVEHGDVNLLLDLYGLSPKKILTRVREHFQI